MTSSPLPPAEPPPPPPPPRHEAIKLAVFLRILHAPIL